MDFVKRNKPILSVGLVIALVFFLTGWHAGQRRVPRDVVGLDNKVEDQPQTVDFGAFWKAWNIISDKYVPASTTAKAVNDQDKVYGAIQGLAASLGDPYTVFFPPVESKNFNDEVRGNFEGVGMEVASQNGGITVIAPLKGSPAEAAGVHAGDRIIKINDKETNSLSTDQAVQLIRGPKGTVVTITVFRTGKKEPFDIKITRDIINIPTINTKELPGGIFDIELYSFTENSPNLFRSALRKFVQSGDSKLILDLRGNPGGYLEAAIDMASWFLPSSKVVVKENFGVSQPEQVYRSRGYDIFNDQLKMIILVDSGSASASEILAGALSEQGIATLVGEKTFGKGSVQELVPITSDTSLKVTIARWLTPNGLSISEKGITPDVVVPRTSTDKEKNKDPQIDKAVELLNK